MSDSLNSHECDPFLELDYGVFLLKTDLSKDNLEDLSNGFKDFFSD